MYLRLRASIVVICLMVTSAKMLAQQPVAAAPPAAPTPEPEIDTLPSLAESNFFDIGLRGTAYADGSDEARHQRYRDLRNGITLDAFRFSKERHRDGSRSSPTTSATGTSATRLRSINSARSRPVSNGTRLPCSSVKTRCRCHTPTIAWRPRIDDVIQTGLQTGRRRCRASSGRRSRSRCGPSATSPISSSTYTPSADTRRRTSWSRTRRKTGSQPWAGTFGFSDAVELAVPVDTRTTDLALRSSGPTAAARRAWLRRLVLHQPHRYARLGQSAAHHRLAVAGPLQGRMSLWPDSTMNAGSLMGTLDLPKRSRATAYISVGNWSQNAR